MGGWRVLMWSANSLTVGSMVRPTTPTLTDAELRIMHVLWDHGPSTAAEIVDALPRKQKVADSSARTILRILEQKNYVRHSKDGRAFVYRAVVERAEARKSVLEYVVARFFNSSPELLVLNLLENETIDPAEIDRLRALIDDASAGGAA
jgi:BlaI family transcriptional regulator, penicillinase repressor